MAARVLDVPPERAYRLVAALHQHGRWVPLTRVDARRGVPHPGDLVEARTAGVFLDRMRVLRVEPPHLLVLAKLGPVLLGTATITVTPAPGGCARVTWDYDARLRGPLPAAALVGPLLEAMAALALWRMARWLRRTRPGD